jgi:hypothetical protein
MGESLLVHSPNNEDSCPGEEHLDDVFEASSSCQHYMRPRNQRNKCLSASMGLDLDSIKGPSTSSTGRVLFATWSIKR